MKDPKMPTSDWNPDFAGPDDTPEDGAHTHARRFTKQDQLLARYTILLDVKDRRIEELERETAQDALRILGLEARIEEQRVDDVEQFEQRIEELEAEKDDMRKTARLFAARNQGLDKRIEELEADLESERRTREKLAERFQKTLLDPERARVKKLEQVQEFRALWDRRTADAVEKALTEIKNGDSLAAQATLLLILEMRAKRVWPNKKLEDG